ncbi:low molecular weight protein-tyrosine-phosphatase [Kozakia baliensis]|uniref:low molecular weight protein-tyrosine-phosphatase n=1 Tax=Kozakia baliensis TaxID=153496 RepID=UPI0004979B42|nr:low molecular weight protein-tyrosine-phosphatase [Kozakia baliensis]
MPSFLFVCTGNICRSPLAEAAMRAEAKRRKLDVEIDSAGTGAWHLAHPPDRRARKIAKKHGLNIDSYRARLVTKEDFTRFDYILALDESHFYYLRELAPAHTRDKITLLLDHVPGREGEEVLDPYYGTEADFDVTWTDVQEACAHLATKTLDRP